MAEQYTQTLIAKPKEFVPSANQVQQFLSVMVTKGVVPLPVKVTGQKPTGRTSTLPNPFGGEPFVYENRIPIKIESVDGIANAVASLSDYEVTVEGVGRPEVPPLPIEFSDPYSVSMSCRVSSTLRSTSDLHDKPSYGKPCDAGFNVGLFTNPHTGKTIRVAEAGYARFWIEIQLGKFLFPQIENENLALLNPTVVAEAHQAFGIEFVQGCYWG